MTKYLLKVSEEIPEKEEMLNKSLQEINRLIPNLKDSVNVISLSADLLLETQKSKQEHEKIISTFKMYKQQIEQYLEKRSEHLEKVASQQFDHAFTSLSLPSQVEQFKSYQRDFNQYKQGKKNLGLKDLDERHKNMQLLLSILQKDLLNTNKYNFVINQYNDMKEAVESMKEAFTIKKIDNMREKGKSMEDFLNEQATGYQNQCLKFLESASLKDLSKEIASLSAAIKQEIQKEEEKSLNVIKGFNDNVEEILKYERYCQNFLNDLKHSIQDHDYSKLSTGKLLINQAIKNIDPLFKPIKENSININKALDISNQSQNEDLRQQRARFTDLFDKTKSPDLSTFLKNRKAFLKDLKENLQKIEAQQDAFIRAGGTFGSATDNIIRKAIDEVSASIGYGHPLSSIVDSAILEAQSRLTGIDGNSLTPNDIQNLDNVKVEELARQIISQNTDNIAAIMNHYQEDKLPNYTPEPNSQQEISIQKIERADILIRRAIKDVNADIEDTHPLRTIIGNARLEAMSQLTGIDSNLLTNNEIQKLDIAKVEERACQIISQNSNHMTAIVQHYHGRT